MKKASILICVVTLMFAMLCCVQESTYTIKGNIQNVKDGTAVYMLSQINGENQIDSTYIENNQFTFKGTLTEPFKSNIIIKHDESEDQKITDRLELYVEKRKIQLTGTDFIKDATISNSPLNDQSNKWIELYKSIEDAIAVRRNFATAASEEDWNSEEFIDEFLRKNDSIDTLKKEMIISFIKQYPDSYFCLDHLFPLYTGGYNQDGFDAESVFVLFSEEMKNTSLGKEYFDNIEMWKKTSVGALAPDFTQNDPDGNPVKLSDFRGKYVLLDFWASWCGPCRQENPHVVTAYNTFKDKGFTVLGVSLDDGSRNGQEAWLKAIKEDNLTWTQVSDLKYWDNEVAVTYGVRGIPMNFLLDPDGKIIDKNLRGKKLIKKLSEVLK